MHLKIILNILFAEISTFFFHVDIIFLGGKITLFSEADVKNKKINNNNEKIFQRCMGFEK